MLNTIRLGTNQPPRIIYAYTADDERLFSFDVSTGITHWTVRGLDNSVLRDLRQQGNAWSVERDYVYRGGLLLAALKPGGAVEHYTLDHLGTPRLITDGAGNKIGYHAYWPFGEEWSPGNALEAYPLKFTGHERDADPTNGAAGLDYMHARYFQAQWGRFLSVDPVLDAKKAIRNPQGWNRNAYVRNNPIILIDPDGRDDLFIGEDFQITPTKGPCPGSPSACRNLDRLTTGITVGLAVPIVLGVAGYSLPAATTSFLSNPTAWTAGAATVVDLIGPSSPQSVGASISGEILHEIATSKGSVGILANATTKGTTLTLTDAAVYPMAAGKLTLGTKEAFVALKQFGLQLKALGYTKLVIQGIRATGANPGKKAEVVLDLTKL